MRIMTERLTLTPFAHGDIAACQMYMNEDITLPESLALPESYRDRDFGARRFFYGLVNTSHAWQEAYYIVLRFKGYEQQPMFGILCFELFDPVKKVWQRSYWMEAEHRKHGLMIEASAAATRWMFEQKNATIIQSVISEENERSSNICKKQGFHHRVNLPQGLPIWTVTAAEFMAANGTVSA